MHVLGYCVCVSACVHVCLSMPKQSRERSALLKIMDYKSYLLDFVNCEKILKTCEVKFWLDQLFTFIIVNTFYKYL